MATKRKGLNNRLQHHFKKTLSPSKIKHHTIPLNTIIDIYIQLTDQAIRNTETNIRLAWAAVTLGNRLLVGLCHCFQNACTCATQKTSETLSFLKNSIQAILNWEHLFRQKAGMPFTPKPHGGWIGTHDGSLYNTRRSYGVCELQNQGLFGDPSRIFKAFVHPLEATVNYASTGPQFALGERITSLEQGLGVVASRWLGGRKAKAQGRGMGWGAIACHHHHGLFRICLSI